jgi:hypothetical protein
MRRRARSNTAGRRAFGSPSSTGLPPVALAVGRKPIVHLCAVPGLVLGTPGVAEIAELLRARRQCVEVKPQLIAVGVLGIDLLEGRTAAARRIRGRIVEARTPRNDPKSWSNERFSCMKITMWSMSCGDVAGR